MRRKRAQWIRRIHSFSGIPVLVVGDLMVDHYIWGQVERISPEAPVPVVEVTRDSLHPGGAANVGANIQGLGGVPRLVGVVGKDEAGTWLARTLQERGMDGGGLVEDPSRPTTRKTRVIAHQQHVVRFDWERKAPLDSSVEGELLRRIHVQIQGVRAVVVSDYAKGVITPRVFQQLAQWAQERGIPLVVDPKQFPFSCYRGATLITPNLSEAARATGRDLSQETGVAAAGREILEQVGAQAVLITRGEAGMTLVVRDGDPVHVPAVAREVFDVTGAGDTVVGTLALALAAGASLEEATWLANYAAGVVVGHVGTAAVQASELIQALRDHAP